MPLYGWALIVIAALLAVMWLVDRRTKARGARLNDPGAMARGVTAPQAHPEAHIEGMRRFEGPGGQW